MAFKYLSKDVILGFDKYKYNAIDTSPVSNYITHPFWNWCVEFFPKWIAPNAITLSGFMFLVLQFALLSYYDYSYYASSDIHPDYLPIPNWVWLVSAICIFLAHTLDGIDGKQARRTKTSGPLGELFDHGLDSWATLFMPIGIYSLFGRGDFSLDVDRVYFIVLSVNFTFIVSHWEKYNTGVLFLPWSYDLSQISLVVLYIIGYIGGYKVYKFMFPVLDTSAGNVFEVVMHMAVLFFSVPMSLWNVYVAYRDRTGKMYSFHEANRPLYPALLLYALMLLWAAYSPYDIIKKEPRLFYCVTGTVFSNIASRLIVSGMSNTRCQSFNWLLLPLISIVISIFTIRLGNMEVYLLWAYTIFVTAAHLHYGFCVVQQLADHFNIYVFSVERPAHKQENNKK